jgi:hypothetical protein
LKTKSSHLAVLVNWRRPGDLMLLFRWLILLLLIGACVSFAFYAGTGQDKYKRFGLLTLKWTLIAAFGFFAVLILERLA